MNPFHLQLPCFGRWLHTKSIKHSSFEQAQFEMIAGVITPVFESEGVPLKGWQLEAFLDSYRSCSLLTQQNTILLCSASIIDFGSKAAEKQSITVNDLNQSVSEPSEEDEAETESFYQRQLAVKINEWFEERTNHASILRFVLNDDEYRRLQKWRASAFFIHNNCLRLRGLSLMVRQSPAKHVLFLTCDV